MGFLWAYFVASMVATLLRPPLVYTVCLPAILMAMQAAYSHNLLYPSLPR